MSTEASAEGHKHDVTSCQLVNIATNWTILPNQHMPAYQGGLQAISSSYEVQRTCYRLAAAPASCSKQRWTLGKTLSVGSFVRLATMSRKVSQQSTMVFAASPCRNIEWQDMCGITPGAEPSKTQEMECKSS